MPIKSTTQLQTRNQTEIPSLYNENKSKQGGETMPNLKHLLDDLEEIGVEPDRVRIPGQLYDSMVADAEETIEENPEGEE